jgi:hypothetical protein
MWKLQHATVGLVAFALTGSAVAQPKVSGRTIGVVNSTTLTGSGSTKFGVVIEIDAESMTIVTPNSREPEAIPKEYKLYPVRRMAEGKVLDNVSAAKSYLWQDVKKGDYISAASVVDDDDQKLYCLAITISRRPGDVLPKGQITKGDEGRYGRESLLNDIENKKDVDDAEVKKYFPRVELRDPRSGAVELYDTGGLPRDYQAKLDAIRAKKKDDVKATPPEKK